MLATPSSRRAQRDNRIDFGCAPCGNETRSEADDRYDNASEDERSGIPSTHLKQPRLDNASHHEGASQSDEESDANQPGSLFQNQTRDIRRLCAECQRRKAASGYSSASRAPTTSSSAWACESVMPGFYRPVTVRGPPPRSPSGLPGKKTSALSLVEANPSVATPTTV